MLCRSAAYTSALKGAEMFILQQNAYHTLYFVFYKVLKNGRLDI
jgi:hypothetical protein